MTEQIDQGNYEILRRRLDEQAKALVERTGLLDEARKKTFGGSELAVLANERVRTENNCVPRDLVSFRGTLVMGYKVFLGLRAETQVHDVLSLHRFVRADDGSWDLSELPRDTIPGFLSDPRFLKEFGDLFKYYRETKLLQLRVESDRILAIFQTGATLGDQRVLRWSVDAAGHVAYLDERGDRDHVFPHPFDFEWKVVGREHQRSGRHPHLSIEDELFVETIHGDLTIKIEDNTETGQGIYAEQVEDPNQALDDAEIKYAKVGGLILLSMRPYRETKTRYLVFNRRTKEVQRIDAIGQSCRQLPEDHGIIFPGGYYLDVGEGKIFDRQVEGLELFRVIKSPNGEDVLFVYHRRDQGLYQLLSYNLIRKEVATPIVCHGMSLFADGTLVVFRSSSEEPSRIHPVQIWRTPYTSAEHAAEAGTDGSFLSKIGNAELVRGISDSYSIAKMAQKAELARSTYEEIVKNAERVADAYHWIGSAEAFELRAAIFEVKKTAELVIDELEKVLAMKKRASDALEAARKARDELTRKTRPEDMRSVDDFMGALTSLRGQRGQLVSLREIRYVDLPLVDALEKATIADQEKVSAACVVFLSSADALLPVSQKLDEIDLAIGKVDKTVDARPLGEELDRVGAGLTVLSEVVGGLEVDDPVQRARILENIGDVFAKQNRVRAVLEARRRELAAVEGRATFGAQLKLLGQSVSSSLAVADSPEKCDTELARLLVALEEVEAKFGELDEFVLELAKKREEITDALGAKKQQLLEERQKRAQSLLQAAERILEGVSRRSRGFKSEDELNAYFASDAMVAKLRQIAEQLRSIGDTVRADEVDGKGKAARQNALRALRDKLDLFEEGDSVVRLGRHKFSVNNQPLELTIVPRTSGDADDTTLALHLTGTDFFEPLEDPALVAAKPYWAQALVSETKDVYRGEYLAASILFDAEEGKSGLGLAKLAAVQHDEAALLELVRGYAQPRYDEGYDRGVHDADAAKILGQLLTLRASAGLLRFAATPRALACSFWAFGFAPQGLQGASSGAPASALLDASAKTLLQRRAASLGRLRATTSDGAGLGQLADELASAITRHAAAMDLPADASDARVAAAYLVEELAKEPVRFATSAPADSLTEALRAHLEVAGARRSFDDDLRALEGDPRARLALVRAWMRGIAQKTPELAHAELEASVLVATDRKLEREVLHALVSSEVRDLFGQHPRIADRKLTLRLDELLSRLFAYRTHHVPGFRAYRELRHTLLERERKRLRLEELKAKPMSSFVRNRLVDQVYLPMVGDNLAKQLGALGEGKRTDTMGLLLLVSPPGYGKTTLMEYVANRLGLVFVKVNGPSLGHEVTSVDPADAPDATSRQEVEKINLALEMGNNVMLYLDDIQHTSSELLQKFISMCDAQRRMEGVWNGKTRTYDLRGKKFCVVMAGNPYTETGEKFRIPDMLANRADTYNLGEVLEGKAEAFALSYVENCLTANGVLSPLATRSAKDVDKILRIAMGEPIATTELEHGYSGAELAEITGVLQRLFRVRDVLLKVNAEYILSASQEDAYRTEPPFKLQGSYRNMTKMAGKVVAAMNDDELERLVDDHYRGESQTLTVGGEQNLLKLAELRGRMNDVQKARWAEIKAEFKRRKTMGSGTDDPVTRVTGTLSVLGQNLDEIKEALGLAISRADVAEKDRKEMIVALAETAKLQGEITRAALTDGRDKNAPPWLAESLGELRRSIESMGKPDIQVTVEPPPGYGEMLSHQIAVTEQTLIPLVQSAAKNLDDAHSLHEHMIQLLDLLKKIDLRLRG
ncbi:MAG: DNA repair ATPase [Sandaracinaceae bacterium]|nr:DNA repair ATPase [Sandaracinaceae bacterium]